MTIHSLLTPDNCTVIFIDRQLLLNNTVGLAKAAKVFKVPVILTTVETKSFSGNMWPGRGEPKALRGQGFSFIPQEVY